MIYVNSINPGEIKGPHIHKKRITYFSCIHGSIVLIVKDDEKFHEIKLDSGKPVLVSIPNGTAVALINPTEMIAKVLVLADIAWRPDDNEMDNTMFDDYDWRKWSKNLSATKK
jgi:dTDP-4-dehydrorhamnose 3,5-epimerase